MASQLQGNERWSITGSWKTSMTVDEMTEYIKENGGGTGEGVTEEQMDTAISKGVAPKADKTYVDSELAKKPSKSEVDTSIDTKVSQLGQTLGGELEEFDRRKANVGEVVTGVNGSAGNVTVNKTTIGLDNVDNTADSAKPVSSAQKTALDKKVDLQGLLKTIEATPAVIHTGEAQVDCHKLDYGQHLIRTDNAINAPPDTKITLLYVVKTHDEVGSGGVGQVLKPTDFEQGTISESSAVGTDYELAKYPPTEPLHGSRIRSKNPIPITEFSTITVADGFEYSVLAFDSNQEYLGRSTFLNWDSNPRLTYPNASYIAVAVRKKGATATEPITPEEAIQAKLTVMTLGQTSGGSKLLIAWGATMGDLHTCVNIAGAWSAWSMIGSVIPKDANEGDHLVFRSGKWVAEAPAVEI